MQDTLSRHSFVLFSCDMWSIVGRFSVTSPTALAAELSGHREMLSFPKGVSWRRVARRVFDGFPAFFLSGDERGGYLLIKAEDVEFYRVHQRRLTKGEASVWSMADHNRAVSEFNSSHIAE